MFPFNRSPVFKDSDSAFVTLLQGVVFGLFVYGLHRVKNHLAPSLIQAERHGTPPIDFTSEVSRYDLDRRWAALASKTMSMVESADITPRARREILHTVSAVENDDADGKE